MRVSVNRRRYLSKGASGVVYQGQWRGMAVAVKKFFAVDEGAAQYPQLSAFHARWNLNCLTFSIYLRV